MLKLEKCAKSCHITISLRHRDTFFSPLLIKALVFALSIHFVAILLFHIKPFKITSTFLYPPIQVEAEPSFEISSPFLLLQEDESIQYLTPPTPIDNLSYFFPVSHFQNQTQLQLIDFASIEEKYWPIYSPPLTIEKPAITLYVSGDLSAYPLLNSDPRLESKILLNNPAKDPYYINYKVKLDGKTGVIFWYERVQSSGVVEKDFLTEQILLNTKFKSISTTFVPVSGWLNFVIY
ncbi:hypothetical protein [Candidatus Protochlamydia amoebophila]|uniref:Uncharacterized protein n=1 Tax=Protochlamydia amoebophila (strain UWE25) TaxID=264201 RepID=Q6MAX6_PARUW|nr:hypothetical protein [Candidatus Protochlamydia amoebophila]CAF24273.1 unnamed protein product [Candidatus Protochlamydia amoebophila UWE25]